MKKYAHLFGICFVFLILIFINVACNDNKVEEKNLTPTPISTIGPTPIFTVTPTSTLDLTPTSIVVSLIPTTAPTTTSTSTPTPTLIPTPTFTPIPTITPMPTPTVSLAPTSTLTPTPTVTPTPTPTIDPNRNINIMIMARQHGNEPAGTSAVFAYISDLVNDSAQYEFTNSNVLTSSDVSTEITHIQNINLSTLDIQVSNIGNSVDGTALYCIKIERPSGQPGNSLLPSNVTLFFVPMVNPDGADANTRENAHGANINRDWDALFQPETQDVHNNVFNVYNPEIVLDMHEFTAYSDRNFDMTYCPGTRDETPEQTPIQLKDLTTAFEPIVNQTLTDNSINYSITQWARTTIGWVEGDSVYGGNHFCIKHYAISYTIETKGIPAQLPLPSLASRVNMHRLFFQTMITYASDNKDQIISTISGLRGY